MKKFTKLFALLLTVCLILGAIAVYASAEEKSQLDASQYGEKITNYSYSTYDASDAAVNFVAGGSAGTFVSSSIGSVSGSANKFVKFTTKSTTTEPGGPFHYVMMNKSGNTISTKGYDYVTADLDFAAISDGGYIDGMQFAIYTISPAYPAPVYIVKYNGEWYATSASAYDETKPAIKISSEVGVWNHLTFAWDLTSTTSKMHAYVNGEYLYTTSIKVGATTEFERLSIRYPKTVTSSHPASFAVDNVASNHYNDGYTSGAAYGIDDLCKAGGKGSVSLCSDVVYQASYAYASPVEKQVAATVDGVGYATAPAASAKVVDGSNIVVKNDFCYTGKASHFTATVYDGANFTLAANAGEFTTKVIEDGEGYTVYEIVCNINYLGDGYTTLYTHNYQDGTEGIKETYLAYDGNFQSAVITDGDNKYVQISDKSTATLAKNAVYRIPLVASTSNNTTELLGDYDYTVLDFDMKTDSNFYDNVWFGFHKGIANNWQEFIRIKGKDGKMMINEKIDISEKVDEWIHVTVIVVPDKATYVYLDGEYFNFVSAISSTERIARLDIFFNKDTTVHDFTLGIDNLQLRRFDKGYNSGADIFGIDDYMDLADKTLPIYQLEDMVYGENYTYFGDTENAPAASIGEVDYYVPSSAFKFAKDNDTITLNKDVTLIKGLGDSINTLNIAGSGSVNFHKTISNLYTLADGKLVKNQLYTVELYEGSARLASYDFKVGAPIDTSLFNVATAAKGNPKNADAWLYENELGELLPLNEFEGAGMGETVILVANVASVNWLDNYSEPLATESWLVGSVADHGFDGLEVIDKLNNGWYELEYFWNGKGADRTVKGDMNFYPVIAPVEAFSGLMYNYTFSYAFTPSYYVPVPAEDSGVVVTKGLYATTINVDKGEAGKKYYDDITLSIVNPTNLHEHAPDTVVSVGDKSYYKFVGGSVSAFAWYGVNAFEAYYTVEYEGNTYELSSKVAITRLGSKTGESVTVPSYINTVLKNNECGSKECKLIVNWVNYAREAYNAQGSYVDLVDPKSIIEKHTDCGCLIDLTDALPAEKPELTYENLAGYGATYFVDASYSRLGLYVPAEIYEANKDSLKITASFTGINGRSISEMSLAFSPKQVVDESNSTEELTVYKDATTTSGGKTYYIFEMDKNHAIYNNNAVYTITVKIGDEVVASGTYSLAAYIYNLNEQLELYSYENGAWVIDGTKPMTGVASRNYRLLRVAMAYSNFAKAAYEFKVD